MYNIMYHDTILKYVLLNLMIILLLLKVIRNLKNIVRMIYIILFICILFVKNNELDSLLVIIDMLLEVFCIFIHY